MSTIEAIGLTATWLPSNPARLGIQVPNLTPAFRGRGPERAVLDEMLKRAHEGQSAVLVMRGEAGIGKTALIQYCVRQASGCRVARIAGFQSELEMPYAALHQLCEPMLGDLAALPEPQQLALRIAFGLAAGTAPDRFVVGLAVLGLLAETATHRPLVCLVDDAQWLDEPSRQVLEFVGRRLFAEAIMLVFAAREAGDGEAFSLPTMTLDGLTREDARALLTAAVPGQLDDQVRDRIVEETHGNPLQLLELLRAMSAAELAGGFGAPQLGGFASHLEEHYSRRVQALPRPAQQILMLAAADPTGDATLLWRAAKILGVCRETAAGAESEQLLEIGDRVRFRHPLVRSAAYGAGTPDDRRAAHAALAEATDNQADPERRLWHLAAAATGPDEAVASELERTAAAAQARAGLAAAAAFLQRSLELTDEPQRRAERALAAAHAHMHAGDFDAALGLLAEARAVAVDDVQRGRIERLRGQVQYASKPGAEAPVRLVQAAKVLEPLDVQLARETYLDAWMASFAAGPRARPGGLLPEVCKAARSAPTAQPPAPPCDLFLDALATVVTDGRTAGAAGLRVAVDTFLGDEIPDNDFVQWGHLATFAASLLWDWRSWDTLSAKHVQLARTSGALAPLSIALNGRGVYAAWCGDFAAATAIVAEYEAVNDATGIGWYSAGGLLQAAYQGRPEALALMSSSAESSARQGIGQGAQYARWTTAILCNGLGRYADALAAAELAAYEMETPNGTGWALPELIEAAVRARRPEVARDAMRKLAEQTIDGADWAAGIEARCRALVSDDTAAEHWYTEAIQRLARTPLQTDLARAHLLYGEWLRRLGRQVHAREQLSTAYEMSAALGLGAFAQRARRELLATGVRTHTRERDSQAHNELTAQEEHIARLARDGRTNAEIGAELFLSIRTVEWHLRKVFMKLGIASRRELKEAWPAHKRYPPVAV
jgi:DNA-binding CsgD family transcriptional regulator